MPNFIKDAPWYMKDQKAQDPGEKDGVEQGNQADDEKILFHQRIGNKDKKGQSFDNWYRRGLKPDQKPASSRTDAYVKKLQGGTAQAKPRSHFAKFSKGACSNCGATTHNVKECTERPRKLGAKFTQKNMARDEYDTSLQNVKLNFESKRDRWNGYDPNAYKKDVVDRWRLQEELVSQIQKEKEDEA